MARWTLQDIRWAAFDRDAVAPGLLKLAKAAALVERNSADYATYLCNVFDDDSAFRQAAHDWAADEIRHGDALGRWAELADPNFRFAEAFERFIAGYRIPVEATVSVRGSRTGELVARCMVEIGTSSLYASLQRASSEPVLADICRRIAADELRHFKLFYTHQRRYHASEGVGRWRRLAVALRRVIESRDDELAFAWHCANETGRPYHRKRCAEAYAAHAYAQCRPEVIGRSTAMAFKAIGFDPQGASARVAARLAWELVKRNQRRDVLKELAMPPP